MTLTPSQIERLKKEAKRWKKDSRQRALDHIGGGALSHTAALNLVAKREGFESWAALMKANVVMESPTPVPEPKVGDPFQECEHSPTEGHGDVHWWFTDGNWYALCAGCHAAYPLTGRVRIRDHFKHVESVELEKGRN